MRKRVSDNKTKIIIPLVTVGCALMCISVGFATWITTSGGTTSVLGQVQADDVDNAGHGENVDVITITSIEPYQYAAGYGFVNNGVYASSVDLTGTCLFNVANGKSCFDSFSGSSKSFKLDVTLSTALSGGFSSQGFSSSSISVTSTNFSSTSHTTITNSDTISTTFTVACIDNSENFSFSFSIGLSFANSLTSFPDMGDANLNISFLPKENS